MADFTPRLDVLPAEQRRLWPELRPARDFGYVLYGGTAIALRLLDGKSGTLQLAPGMARSGLPSYCRILNMLL
jgi:hypothetical protein